MASKSSTSRKRGAGTAEKSAPKKAPKAPHLSKTGRDVAQLAQTAGRLLCAFGRRLETEPELVDRLDSQECWNNVHAAWMAAVKLDEPRAKRGALLSAIAATSIEERARAARIAAARQALGHDLSQVDREALLDGHRHVSFSVTVARAAYKDDKAEWRAALGREEGRLSARQRVAAMVKWHLRSYFGQPDIAANLSDEDCEEALYLWGARGARPTAPVLRPRQWEFLADLVNRLGIGAHQKGETIAADPLEQEWHAIKVRGDNC